MTGFTGLENTIIGVPSGDGGAKRAADILAAELSARTGLEFSVGEQGAIRICTDRGAAPGPEGYDFKSGGGRAEISGYDFSGALYGAGRLLRECRWGKGFVELPDLELNTCPKKPLRGCQLGYRNKTNAYSAWDKEHYRRYMTDLALFGANAVELMPGRTDDADTAPVMKYNSREMLIHCSGLARELGMQVWIWYPNMLDNPNGFKIPEEGFLPEDSPEAAEFNRLLREGDERRHGDFSQIPKLDHIMIPGGDPGSLDPADLFAYSARVAKILHQYHPDAGVWISAQVMKNSLAFKLSFYEQVRRRPVWLTGICHAPWVSHTMKECRERTPLDLPIRSYPDICHMLCCQYPVHGMDPVWAVTAGRECYNPRPRWHKRMHNLTAPYNIGNIAYSEGIADDVSKFIWIDQDWDDALPVQKTLRDFASMFISPDHAGDIASLLWAFEDVLTGPALYNTACRHLYFALKEVEGKISGGYMPGFGADSYRFKMPRLMSAFYLYIQKKAARDYGLMEAAWGELFSGLPEDDIIQNIEEDLSSVETSPAPELLAEIWGLADECYERIRWKLGTDRHNSPDYTRGGFLDTLRVPLCNSDWLLEKLKGVKALPAGEKKAALYALYNRQGAGPGGKYLNLGAPGYEQYPRMEKPWFDEPEAITVPRVEHHVGIWNPHRRSDPATPRDKILLERVSSSLGYYNADVVLDIDGLVPGAAYELRVVFPLRFGWMGQPSIPAYVTHEGRRLAPLGPLDGDEWVYCYEIPAGAVDETGKITLTFTKEEGPRGSGATELWLVRA